MSRHGTVNSLLLGDCGRYRRIGLMPGLNQDTFVYLPPTKEEVHVFARVHLSVCLSVSKITQKGVHGFR